MVTRLKANSSMKNKSYLIIVIGLLPVLVMGQSDELVKFYYGYRLSTVEKSKCDSVFNLIESRRKAFSEAYRSYETQNGNHLNFTYDWQPIGRAIERSLGQPLSKAVRDLTYYSYFDIAYGIFGYELNHDIVQRAIENIHVTSVVWAFEPSLLTPIIHAAGGEEKNRLFIDRLYRFNENENLKKYIKGNLSKDRPLKLGVQLPLLTFSYVADSSSHFTIAEFSGKYLLIDIWATWCKPCIEELPNLIDSYSKRNSNLEFISLAIDDGVLTVANFVKTHDGLSWIMGIASKKELLGSLQVNGIPLTILISPSGEIVAYGDSLRNYRLELTLKKFDLLK